MAPVKSKAKPGRFIFSQLVEGPAVHLTFNVEGGHENIQIPLQDALDLMKGVHVSIENHILQTQDAGRRNQRSGTE